MYVSFKSKLKFLIISLIIIMVLLSIYCSVRDKYYEKQSSQYEEVTYGMTIDREGNTSSDKKNSEVHQGSLNDDIGFSLDK